MSQDYETATSAGAYETDPIVAPIAEGPQVYGTPSTDRTDSTGSADSAGSADSTAGASKHVAGVVRGEASNVAGEAKQQTKNLLGQARSELQEQAATQQQRLASGIREMSDQLRSMADGGDPQPGLGNDLVRQTSQRADDVAAWLDQRDPGALVQDVQDFARRRPGAFLAVAAGAGLIAGRLMRGTAAARSDSGDTA
jgi:hypothetical protein